MTCAVCRNENHHQLRNGQGREDRKKKLTQTPAAVTPSRQLILALSWRLPFETAGVTCSCISSSIENSSCRCHRFQDRVVTLFSWSFPSSYSLQESNSA